MRVRIKTLLGKTHAVEADAGTTIGEVKKRIGNEMEMGNITNDLKLVYAGKLLSSDAQTLDEIGVRDEGLCFIIIVTVSLAS